MTTKHNPWRIRRTRDDEIMAQGVNPDDTANTLKLFPDTDEYVVEDQTDNGWNERKSAPTKKSD